MSIVNRNTRLPASFYQLFREKKKILDLSPNLLLKIFSFIQNSDDYKSIRSTCKLFYELHENIKIFSSNNKVSKILYFNNHVLQHVDHFTTLIFSSGITYYYLYKTTNYHNYIKHGTDVEYTCLGNIKKMASYKFGKKNGFSIEYNKNRIKSKENYILNIKNGIQTYFINNFQTTLLLKYVIGIKLNYKKYFKSNLVIDATFKNRWLEGITRIFSKDGRYIINILNFKGSRLQGECKMFQFDRILKLNYNDGLLSGTQSVYTNERKLKFLGEYNNGKLNGKYGIYNEYKKVEEGYYSCGEFDKYINIYNISDFTRYYYPIKNNMLNGVYKETNHLAHISAHYVDNQFVGRYTQSNIKESETIEWIIHNKNNYTYRKYKFGHELIIFTKSFGKYSLTIYNLSDDIESDEEEVVINYNSKKYKKVYKLFNFNSLHEV
jgi:antitoxin component YwqK of YwqJK toxin-antitoxin module